MSKMKYYFLESGRFVSSSLSGRLRGGRRGVDKVGREEEVNLFCFLFYLSHLALAF